MKRSPQHPTAADAPPPARRRTRRQRAAANKPHASGERITATSLADTGDGLATHHGRTLAIAGLLPGEMGRVLVDHIGRARAFGRLSAVERPIAARRTPPCPHQGTCSGCPLMIVEPGARREMLRTMLRETHGLDVDAIRAGEHELGYRFSSKRVVGGVVGAVRLGSYRRASHDLANMDDCHVDHPDLAAAARELGEAASALGIEPYDEARSAGDLRYAWLKTDGRGAVMITLVTANAQSRARDELPARLGRATTVAASVQASSGDALRGAAAEVLRGPPTLCLELCGERVEVGPLGFLQPNPAVAELAYRDLTSGPDGEPCTGALALDLYAGAGVTTRLLRRRFAEVRACESFDESAALLGVAAEQVEPFLRALREERGREGAAPNLDLVVANPPRAGLGEAVCVELAGLRPRQLQLMSCHPASLARDLARLTGHRGCHQLVGVRAYDTLPQTAGVELVAWLTLR